LPAVGSEEPNPFRVLPSEDLLGKNYKTEEQISYRGKIAPGIHYWSIAVGTRTDL